MFFSPLAPKEWPCFLVVKKPWVFGIFGDLQSHAKAAGSAGRNILTPQNDQF